MGKKQRDCATCGAPVGFKGRELCCLCMRRLREQAAKDRCPACGKDRVLNADTGRCVLCSRCCTQCGDPVRAGDATLCRACRRRAAAQAAKAPCPRCGRPGLIRPATGWCGTCSRPPAAPKPARTCTACGALTTHPVNGLCSACWQRHPDRPLVRGEHLIAALAQPPAWLDGFIVFVADRFAPSRATELVSELSRLLSHEGLMLPSAVLDRSRRSGRSMGSLARALEDYFVDNSLALPTDHRERLAAGRRQRRVDGTPADLRPVVQAFATFMINNRDRARRSGTHPRTDHTIESALATVRDLATFIADHRGKHDWAVVDVHDIEAFLALLPRTRARRLAVVRQFFRFARSNKIVLVDPTRGQSAKKTRGFTGRTLRLDQQRVLFHRWTSTDPHPHEALLGILALLHAASSQEVRLLRIAHIDTTQHTIRLGHRPEPVPLDPDSWAVLQRCLAHRQAQDTLNPHVIVTRGTKARQDPASSAYFTHLLDPVGIPPRTVRCTRLAELVNTLDPKLVAAALGMNPDGVIAYLSDYVEEARLPPERANP